MSVQLEVEESGEYLNYLGYREEADGLELLVNAYYDSQLIGSLVFDPGGYIRHIYIDPAFRGQGIMREMFSYYLRRFSSYQFDGDFIDCRLRDKLYSWLIAYEEIEPSLSY